MQNYGVGGPEHAKHLQIWHPEDGEIACECGVTFYADPEPNDDDSAEISDADGRTWRMKS